MTTHEQIITSWQDDFLGSDLERAEFRNWVIQEYGQDEVAQMGDEEADELLNKFRETSWWTDTFLDFAYTSHTRDLERVFQQQLETNPDPSRYGTAELSISFQWDLATISTCVSVPINATRDFAVETARRQIASQLGEIDEEFLNEITVAVEGWSL